MRSRGVDLLQKGRDGAAMTINQTATLNYLLGKLEGIAEMLDSSSQEAILECCETLSALLAESQAEMSAPRGANTSSFIMTDKVPSESEQSEFQPFSGSQHQSVMF